MLTLARRYFKHRGWQVGWWLTASASQSWPINAWIRRGVKVLKHLRFINLFWLHSFRDGSPKQRKAVKKWAEKNISKRFLGKKPSTALIKSTLEKAHEIRQFEIRLYWQRSLFFWGFILTLYAGLGLMVTAEKQGTLVQLMSIGIAALGFFVTCAWYYIEQGSRTWQKNWELHIDYL